MVGRPRVIVTVDDVAALEALGDGDVGVALVVRERFRRLPAVDARQLREDIDAVLDQRL